MDVTDSFYKDLNIFDKAEHPSLLVESWASKEGFSLFNLFDYTVT